VQDYRRLKVWQKAHLLVLDVYSATREFPAEERFGLTSQVRRSAASVPTNIAEGCGRNGSGELLRFLDIAMGSACETEYQLLLARELGYIDPILSDCFAERVGEVKRMLGALIHKLRTGD